MQATQVQVYIQRATDLLEGMKLTRTDGSYCNSAALLAIHSAISYSDALRVGLGDTKLAGDDHSKAITSLERALTGRGEVDATGLKHFRYLISKKHLVAYGNKRLESTDYEALFARAERFAIWADNTGSRCQIKGWNDGE